MTEPLAPAEMAEIRDLAVQSGITRTWPTTQEDWALADAQAAVERARPCRDLTGQGAGQGCAARGDPRGGSCLLCGLGAEQ